MLGGLHGYLISSEKITGQSLSKAVRGCCCLCVGEVSCGPNPAPFFLFYFSHLMHPTHVLSERIHILTLQSTDLAGADWRVEMVICNVIPQACVGW